MAEAAGRDVNAAAVNEIYDAYHRKAVTLQFGLDRIFDPHWRVMAGVNGEASADRALRHLGRLSADRLADAGDLNMANSDVDPTLRATASP